MSSIGFSFDILLLMYILSSPLSEEKKYLLGLEKVALSSLSMKGLLKLNVRYVFIFSTIPWNFVTYGFSDVVDTIDGLNVEVN